MSLQPDRSPATFLFNPFALIAGPSSLLLGIVAIVAAGLVGSRGGVNFDGVLDCHIGGIPVLWLFPLEGLLDWIALALVLSLLGQIVSTTRFRIIDIAGTQALARWPTLLTATAALAPGFQRGYYNWVARFSHRGTAVELPFADRLVFFADLAALFLCLVWMVALMYRSFIVSCNLRGGKAVATFIFGVVIAEVISKIALYKIITYAFPQGLSSLAALSGL